jgi:hypothetical protein
MKLGRNRQGVAGVPKNYTRAMNNFKNILIALLTGLLALSMYTQILGMNKAKAIEYEICLNRSLDRFLESTGPFDPGELKLFDLMIKYDCRKYRP